MQGKIKAAIEEIRPFLQSHGGDVEFVSFEDGVVNVKLQGACHGCAGAQATLKGGIERVELDTTGKPSSELGSFSNNAQNQFLNSYIVSCLLSVDPSKNEADNTLYAAIESTGTGNSSNVSYSKLGLWSYYPDRGNWNRE